MERGGSCAYRCLLEIERREAIHIGRLVANLSAGSAPRGSVRLRCFAREGEVRAMDQDPAEERVYRRNSRPLARGDFECTVGAPYVCALKNPGATWSSEDNDPPPAELPLS